MPPLKKFWSKKNTAIFVWPGAEPLELAYNATRIVVPPADVVGRPGTKDLPGSIYTHEPAVVNGKMVPGTAVIEDVAVVTQEGGYKTVLSVDAVCRYLARDREELFAQGFNIVENEDQVAEAMAYGKPLYLESQDKRAREILAREMARQRAYKDRGEVPPPSLSEHLIAWAMKHLETRGPGQQAHSYDAIQDVLTGKARPKAVQKADPRKPAPEPEVAAEPEPEPPAFPGQAVYLEAMDAGVKLTGIEMAGLLKGSAGMIAAVRKRIAEKQEEKVQATA